jgi:uncharacterized membrane protein YfcA
MTVHPSVIEIIFLGMGALAASTLAAVSGFGGAAVLLPILAAVFGVREAIPILTVAQLIGNASRVGFNWRQLDLRVVMWFSLGAVPMALLGGVLFAKAPLHALTRLLGAFLIFVVVYRPMRPNTFYKPTLKSFAAIGAGASVISALLGSVGPIMAPFFLAYGLMKGAYIGTEALATVVMHVTKMVAYRKMDILSLRMVLIGLALGPIMVVGSLLGNKIVDKIPDRTFALIIEAVMVIAGLMFLVKG